MMSLVTGYGSDSDGETERGPTVQSSGPSGLTSLLPPPAAPSSIANGKLAQSNSATASASNGNAGSKRKVDKLQIRVEAPEANSNADSQRTEKRAKVDAAPSKPGGHGLFSMLPAPSNKEPLTKSSKVVEDGDVANVNKLGIGDASAGALTLQEATGEDTSDDGVKKQKGNNDFRAMLGLKPSKNIPPPKAKSEGASKAAVSSTPATVESSKSAAVQQHSSLSHQNLASDFFSLHDERSGTSSPAAELGKRTIPITLAPSVEDYNVAATTVEEKQHEDPYEGWQQGPDGSWFPVTPHAHAQYHQFLSERAEQDKGLRMAEADAGHIDPSRIQDANVNSSLADWLARPQTDAKAGSDRRYALAAASVANPGQQIELPPDEEEKRADKGTNLRARRKGQLSSLIAQADENREKLEERWARGRAARGEAHRRYGF